MGPIDRERSVVLIMDYQNDIVSRFMQVDASMLQRAADVLAASRQAGLPVIYVAVQFRPGYPEVPDFGMFKMVKGSSAAMHSRPPTIAR